MFKGIYIVLDKENYKSPFANAYKRVIRTLNKAIRVSEVCLVLITMIALLGIFVVNADGIRGWYSASICGAYGLGIFIYLLCINILNSLNKENLCHLDMLNKCSIDDPEFIEAVMFTPYGKDKILRLICTLIACDDVHVRFDNYNAIFECSIPYKENKDKQSISTVGFTEGAMVIKPDKISFVRNYSPEKNCIYYQYSIYEYEGLVHEVLRSHT